MASGDSRKQPVSALRKARMLLKKSLRQVEQGNGLSLQVVFDVRAMAVSGHRCFRLFTLL